MIWRGTGDYGKVGHPMEDLRAEIRSDFLFARPSFAEGVARIVDLGNSLNTYNVSRDGNDADARAIYEDWRALGHDVRIALRKLVPVR